VEKRDIYKKLISWLLTSTCQRCDAVVPKDLYHQFLCTEIQNPMCDVQYFCVHCAASMFALAIAVASAEAVGMDASEDSSEAWELAAALDAIDATEEEEEEDGMADDAEDADDELGTCETTEDEEDSPNEELLSSEEEEREERSAITASTRVMRMMSASPRSVSLTVPITRTSSLRYISRVTASLWSNRYCPSPRERRCVPSSGIAPSKARRTPR